MKSNLTERDIQKALWQKFVHHKYRFLNTYFFSTEQDYLTFLQNGYCWEIEIKRTRSDYRADFKKTKHREYQEVRGNVRYRANKVREVWVQTDKDYVECDTMRHRHDYRRGVDGMVVSEWVKTAIEFRKVSETEAPNKFWYAVPKGLIGLDELPDYAGLIEVDVFGSAHIVRRAPFLHKGLVDVKKSFNLVYRKYESVQSKIVFDR